MDKNADHSLAATQEFVIPGLSNLPVSSAGPATSDHNESVNDFLNFTQPFNVAHIPGNSGGRSVEDFDSGSHDDLVNGTQAFDVSSVSVDPGDDAKEADPAQSCLFGSSQAFMPPPSSTVRQSAGVVPDRVAASESESPRDDSDAADSSLEPAEPDRHDDPSVTQSFDPGTDVSVADDGITENTAGSVVLEDDQHNSDNDEDRITLSHIEDNSTKRSGKRRISSDDEDDDACAVKDADEIQSIASLSSEGVPAASLGDDDEEENSRPPKDRSSTDGGDAALAADSAVAEPAVAEAAAGSSSFASSPTAALIANAPIDDDDNEADKKSEVGELIADIFGESDEEAVENEQTEPKDDDAEEPGDVNDNLEDYREDDLLPDDDDDRERQVETEFVSDFDIMMHKRKMSNQRYRRRKRDYEFINNNDDMINELLSQMRLAAKEDIDLNTLQQPATRKRTLLPSVVRELKKADLLSAFIESGVVNVMAEWLSLLPDKSMPSLEIRTEFLKILQTFPTLDHQILRSSNIGKSVMLLFKHPKETKENKVRAQKLINEWARPIFNLQTDYRSLTKDERIKRDFDHMPVAKKRRMSLEEKEASAGGKTEKEVKALGPGDKGFIGRARVPRPSTKDYVVRPKWNVETEYRNIGSKKQTATKMDKKIREIKMRSVSNKAEHAVGISLSGGRVGS